MYRSAIVDELGHVVAWCSEISEEEKQELLNNHEEFTIRCIEVF